MDPHEDGTKHLNVSHNAKTQLGRMLSPPYPAEVQLPDDGTFSSVGGYWCWLLWHREEFRELSGENLFVEKEFPKARKQVESREFQEKILKATWHKIRQNSNIFWRFEQNILPFRRYYVMEDRIYKPSDAEWICDGLKTMIGYVDHNFW